MEFRKPHRFARLINLHGVVTRVEGWWDSNGEQALGHRKSLRSQTVLAAFSAVGNDATHWSPVAVSKKITVNESVPTRTLAFVGQESEGHRVVLELFSPRYVITTWDHRSDRVKVKIDGPDLGDVDPHQKGIIGYIWGLYWGNGKENGSYYSIMGSIGG